MTPPGPLDRLWQLLAAEADRPLETMGTGPPIGVGWATVELDRAAVELGGALGIPAAAFMDAPESVLLGARCRVAHRVLSDGISLVLLEPATEGRLAATLARRGEGPAATWLAAQDGGPSSGEPGAGRVPASPARPGPLGPERLISADSVHGPHRLLVGRAGTIGA